MKLTRWERRWLVALFEGFSPPDPRGHDGEGGMAPKPGEVDHVGGFELLNGEGTLLAQVGLRFAVVLLGTSPMWSGKAMKGFDRLGRDERVALLEEMGAHKSALVRELTWLMKVQASMTLFGNPAIRTRSGYDRGREQGMPVQIRLKRDEARTESGVRALDVDDEQEKVA